MTVTLWQAADVAYEPSEQLKAAIDAVAEAEAAHKAAVAKLHQAVADEVAKPTRPADVARFMGWHAGYVRKLARERGVPGFVDVEPPRRRPSTDHG